MRWIAVLPVVLWSAAVHAAPPRVVATIAPLHSLVAAVMQGAGEPGLIVQGAVSPHDFALRPADARKLADADILFRIGGPVEASLDKPIATLATHAKVVSMFDQPDLQLLQARGPDWRGGDRAASPASPLVDGHVWLDPANAGVMGEAIARALIAADPDHAAIYKANAAKLPGDLAAADRQIRQALDPVRGRPFVVYHDAYHYFERRYGLNDIGALTQDPEQPPGAQHVAAIQRAMTAAGARCLFVEPETQPALAETLRAATGAKIVSLDPLEATLKPGPSYYLDGLKKLAADMAACLN